MNQPPKTIFLQTDGKPWDELENTYGDITWCSSAMEGGDEQYIQMSEVEDILQKGIQAFRDGSSGGDISSLIANHIELLFLRLKAVTNQEGD